MIKNIKVWISPYLHRSVYQAVLAGGVDAVIGSGYDPEGWAEQIQACTCALTFAHERISAEILQNCQKLNIIIHMGISVPEGWSESLESFGISLVHAPVGTVDSMAEHGLFLLMSSGKHAHFLFRSMMINKGFDKGLPGQEIERKHVLLVGTNPAAEMFAQKASGVGLDVTRTELPVLDWEELIGRADFLVLMSPPFEPVGANVFEAMKPSAFFIDMTDGTGVDRGELRRALCSKQIAGAGLDWGVLDSEIMMLDQVVATPLLGAQTKTGYADALEILKKTGVVK